MNPLLLMAGLGALNLAIIALVLCVWLHERKEARRGNG